MRLDVAVDEADPVDGGERVRRASSASATARCSGSGAAREHVGQRPAGDDVHDEVRAAAGLAHLVDPRQAGVVDARHQGRLAAERGERLRGVAGGHRSSSLSAYSAPPRRTR